LVKPCDKLFIAAEQTNLCHCERSAANILSNIKLLKLMHVCVVVIV